MSASTDRSWRRDAGMDVDDDPSIRRRGRGFGAGAAADEGDGVRSNQFERLPAEGDQDGHAAQSMEGWVIVVTNVHEEATEDDVLDVFLDFGKVKDLHLNLDRRTGYVKGYALLQYETQAEAESAIAACKRGLALLEQPLDADYAFVRPPSYAADLGARGARRGGARDRSLSPMRS
ncbi:Similar to S.cerevisiae protein IST3 (Component of the U2 snRNP) [Malassezia sympodialis ATCC 42132]|uniref:Similar to S.cerevisiae protein IST3 (Component of the U2 snRNP) n=1 Tax=Malassezia sympodialis (strain ATCC 42132) TaxID=1230383 RepID=A0A1M8A8Y3_MALS4|nr:Similar to S.cerevisiae protein IST3 (Component of the U2 snRNP) [Malassezia sympodialis ATCC 42132]